MTLTQATLFSPDVYGGAAPAPPLARHTDPPSSAAAAERHRRSGRLGSNSAAVLALVQAHPGSTYRELWAAAPEAVQGQLGDPIELMRRLGSLMRKGWVQHGPARACRVRGTEMVTWHTAGGVHA